MPCASIMDRPNLPSTQNKTIYSSVTRAQASPRAHDSGCVDALDAIGEHQQPRAMQIYSRRICSRQWLVDLNEGDVWWNQIGAGQFSMSRKEALKVIRSCEARVKANSAMRSTENTE